MRLRARPGTGARGALALAVAIALGAAACSSSDGGGDAGSGTGATTAPSDDTAATTTPATETTTAGAVDPGPTTGLTDTTMHVSVIVPDFGGLVEAGLAPDLGDPQAQIQAYVDHINAQGGIAGRQVELSFHTFAVPATQAGLRATCLEATQDNEAFVVIGAAALPPDGSLCVAADNATPIITQAGLTPSIFDDSEGRIFTTGMAWDRVRRGWVQALHDRGDLEGKTIGILTDDADRFRLEAVEVGLEAELDALGYEVAEKVVLPCEEGTTNCSQFDVAVTRFQDAGVDYLFVDAGPTANPAFFAAAEAAGMDIEFTLVDQSVNKTVARFLESVAPYIDGTIAVSYSLAPDAGPAGAPSPEQEECNDIYAQASGVVNVPGDDAFSFAANNCANFRILKAAADSLPPDQLGQASIVAAIEALPDEEVVGFHLLNGSFGPGKHDASDYVIVRRFDAASGSFPQVEGEDWRRVEDA
jgi:ABC-type branched-subunit amino acid transport system substrate-binding protein